MTAVAPRTVGKSSWHVVGMRRRTTATLALVTTIGVLAFTWPLLVDADAALAQRSDAPWLFVLLLPLVLAVVLAEIADGGMDAKAVARLYRNRVRGWLVLVLVLLGLAAVVAAIATTPVGQDWWRDIQDWYDEAYAWVKGKVS